MKMKKLREDDYIFTRIAEFKELNAIQAATSEKIDAFVGQMSSGSLSQAERDEHTRQILDWNRRQEVLLRDAYLILSVLCDTVFVD